MKFQQIESTSRWEEVATRVRDAIVSGQLKPSDRLPSRRELAEQFGVSRALVNEAIRVLESSGLVRTRPGAHGGSFVCAPATDQLVRNFDLLIRLGGVSTSDLTDFRLLLEGQNAEWAANRATTVQIRKLKDIMHSLRALNAEDADGGYGIERLDTDFHVVIAEMAHNELSSAAVQGIVPAVRTLNHLLPSDERPIGPQQIIGISEAIIGGDGKRARRLMCEHIQHFSNVIIKAHGSADRTSTEATRR